MRPRSPRSTRRKSLRRGRRLRRSGSGSGPGQGNVIAFNTGGSVDDGQGGMVFVPGDGVAVSYDPNFSDPIFVNDPVVRNRISGNSIHSNQGLGINLDLLQTGPDPQDGPTANDPGDADSGANMFQNFPVLTSAFTSGSSTTIQGTLNSTPSSTFTVEFFSNPSCDPSGFGEGQTFLGSTSVTTDASGNASFTATFTTGPGCQVFTATATDSVGNTSEFSSCINASPTVVCDTSTTSLWPANHNLIDVGLTATASDACSSVSVDVKVYSDEDDEAPTGDGNFSPDAKFTAPSTLRLRAERNGASDGRVYLIIVTATDASGNVARCCKTVTVPKSQSQADQQAVAAQAAAAVAHCQQFGTPPAGYFLVGDGPAVGPKQ